MFNETTSHIPPKSLLINDNQNPPLGDLPVLEDDFIPPLEAAYSSPGRHYLHLLLLASLPLSICGILIHSMSLVHLSLSGYVSMYQSVYFFIAVSLCPLLPIFQPYVFLFEHLYLLSSPIQ